MLSPMNHTVGTCRSTCSKRKNDDNDNTNNSNNEKPPPLLLLLVVETNQWHRHRNLWNTPIEKKIEIDHTIESKTLTKDLLLFSLINR
mmetsp:Transcript_57359/g.64068  ORF Transcript_57359/g.64068 Transcript_57359/m.64068 type:complete len:88 (-) Transcript_57359:46-309(-)